MIDDMCKKFNDLFVETEEGDMGDFINYVRAFFEKDEIEKIDCRGGIIYLDMAPSYFCESYGFGMNTESAWVGRLEIWNAIVKRHYPEVKISYTSEEPGCEYFLCWDEPGSIRYYNCHYYMDGVLPSEKKDEAEIHIEENHWYDSLDEAVMFLRSILHFNFNSSSDPQKISREINEKLEEYGGDYWLVLSAFEKAAPDDPSYFPPIISE